jgi:nucleolar protein 56
MIWLWFGVLDKSLRPIKIIRNFDDLVEHCMKVEPNYAYVSPKEVALKFWDETDYYALLSKVMHEVVRRKIENVERDEKIVQAIETLDDLTKCMNLISERISEWEEIGLENKDLESAREVLHYTREKMIEKVSNEVKKVAPNLYEVATPLIAARLIREAGGLRKLAMMPSSRIQVLGSRGALFRHLRGKAPSPKHGVIYTHPALGTKKERGKRARVLASLISKAARIDYFRRELEPKIVEEMNKKLINKKFSS